MTARTLRPKSVVLTTKQAAYVEARATGLDKGDSMVAAGYANHPTSTADLESLPSIKQALSAEFRKNQHMLGLTRNDVLQGMKDAIDQAKLISDPMTQVAGWREIAKVCGFYAPEIKRIQISGSGQKILSQLEQMDDAELLQIAQGDVLEGEFEEVKNA